MTTLIAILIILAILFLSIGCIVKEKKRGVRCIGCPAAGSCTKCRSAEKLEKEIKQHIKEHDNA